MLEEKSICRKPGLVPKYGFSRIFTETFRLYRKVPILSKNLSLTGFDPFCGARTHSDSIMREIMVVRFYDSNLRV